MKSLLERIELLEKRIGIKESKFNTFDPNKVDFRNGKFSYPEDVPAMYAYMVDAAGGFGVRLSNEKFVKHVAEKFNITPAQARKVAVYDPRDPERFWKIYPKG